MYFFIIIGIIYGIYTTDITLLLNYLNEINNNNLFNILTYKKIIFTFYYFLNGLLFYYLILSASYDLKDKEIYDKYTVPILIIGLLHFYNIENIAYVALFLISIRYIGALFFNKEVFGEADIIVYTGLAGIFSFTNIIGIYLLSAIFGICYALIQKQRKKEDWDYIPMIPMIVLSIIFINFGLTNYIIKILN